MYVGSEYTLVLNASFLSCRLERGSTIMNAGVVTYFKRQPANCPTKLNLGKGSHLSANPLRKISNRTKYNLP
jgi:hypothetical protein